MLRACHRVLRPGGVLCFAVIAHADGLTADQIATAAAAGPDHADVVGGYPSVLVAAGFHDVDVADVTDAYLETLAAWAREWDAEAVALTRIVGADDFAERQTNRRRAIEAARQGLLRRHVVTAAR